MCPMHSIHQDLNFSDSEGEENKAISYFKQLMNEVHLHFGSCKVPGKVREWWGHFSVVTLYNKTIYAPIGPLITL